MVPMKKQEFQLLPDVVLKPSLAPVTAEFPETGSLGTAENEAAAALDDLARLVAALRAELRNAANIGEVLPLLQAGRTLLETAELKTVKRGPAGH
jgi:hypothetical protein